MFKVVSLSPTKAKFSPLLFAGNLLQGLKKASELGYDGVEISLRDTKEINYSWLKKNLLKLNLKVYGIATGQTYYNDGFSLYNSQSDKRDKAIQRMKEHIDLANKLGSIVIIGGIRGKLETDLPIEQQLNSGKEAIREIAEYAYHHQVTLVLEAINRYETNIFNTLLQIKDFIEELKFPNFKILADTFHMNLEEVSYRQALLEVKDHIGYIHFADSNRWAPGWGHIDFREIINVLKEINFRGPIGIEVLPLPEDLKAAQQGIVFLKKFIEGGELKGSKEMSPL
jgi:sugar phosphate isomerase/epimerase